MGSGQRSQWFGPLQHLAFGGCPAAVGLDGAKKIGHVVGRRLVEGQNVVGHPEAERQRRYPFLYPAVKLSYDRRSEALHPLWRCSEDLALVVAADPSVGTEVPPESAPQPDD